VISYYIVSMCPFNYLSNFFICLFWLCLFHLCPVYCPLLFVFVCCAVSVIGHLAVDWAH
jgi:hypothetical protein